MKEIASEGHAKGGKEGLGGWDRPGSARHGPDELGGRIPRLRTDRRAGVGLHSVVAEESCYSILIRIWCDVVAIKVAKSL